MQAIRDARGRAAGRAGARPRRAARRRCSTGCPTTRHDRASSASMLKGVDFVTSQRARRADPRLPRRRPHGGAVPVRPDGGAAANVTLLSYLDEVQIGVNIDPAAVPDPDVLPRSASRRASPRSLQGRADPCRARRRRRRRRRGGPGGRSRRHHPRPRRPRGRRRRQGHVPPRQVLRRRSHHRRPARCSRSSASTPARSRRGSRSTTSSSARRRARRSRSRCPAAAGTYAAVARRARPRRRPRRRRPRRRGAGARRPRASTRLEPGRRPRRRSTSTGSARSRPATSSPPTGCGRRCASCLGAGEPGYRGEWHAFRQYFTGVGPARPRDLFVWFEPDLLPGYAWSFPLPDGRANVGFGIPRDGGKVERVQDMATLWPDLLARPHIARRPRRRRRRRGAAPGLAHPGPGRRHRRAPPGRVLFVGDAAAATDPMTGEGIGQALLTGVLAAEAVLAGRARPTADAATAATTAPSTATSSPTTACRCCCSGRSRHRKGARLPSASPAPRRGPGATSPAGSSRTTPAPSSSRPGAGGATASAATARFTLQRKVLAFRDARSIHSRDTPPKPRPRSVTVEPKAARGGAARQVRRGSPPSHSPRPGGDPALLGPGLELLDELHRVGADRGDVEDGHARPRAKAAMRSLT